MNCILLLLSLFIVSCILILHVIKSSSSIETFITLSNSKYIKDCNKDLIADTLNSMNNRLRKLKIRAAEKSNMNKYKAMYEDYYIPSTMVYRMAKEQPPPSGTEYNINQDTNESPIKSKKSGKLSQKNVITQESINKTLALDRKRMRENNARLSKQKQTESDKLVSTSIEANTKGKSYMELLNDWADLKKIDVLKDKYEDESEEFNKTKVTKTDIQNYDGDKTDLTNQEIKQKILDIRTENRKFYEKLAKEEVLKVGFIKYPMSVPESKVRLEQDIITLKKVGTQDDMDKENKKVPSFGKVPDFG